jgi:chorismate synthase
MLRFLTAGESHGPYLVGIVEGMPAGVPVNPDAIDGDLRRRQSGYGRGGRMAIERDKAELGAGLANGETTGAPISITIRNLDWPNWKDKELPTLEVPRPGHADLAGALKYRHSDLRLILERASARETAMRVAVGALAKLLLTEFGVSVGSFVTEIGGVEALLYGQPLEDLARRAEDSDVRCPDMEVSQAMRERIDAAREDKDSLGGAFVVVARGVPVGLGSHVHWDRRLDGRLGQAVLSIPAIKGVEIGPAFANARRMGTEVHDEILVDGDGWHRETNRAGGVEGGMSNGEPIVVKAAMKPIPTTLKPLRSVNLGDMTPTEVEYQRSDVCAVPAASIVGEAMVAWVLAQALMEKYGGDSIQEMRSRGHR